MRPVALLLALPLLACSGCHSYLLPFDERPINAPIPLETEGGQRLDLDTKGQLMLRAGAGDLASALGVSLYPTKYGLMVTNRLRADTKLQPEDQIVYVAAVLPVGGQRVRQAHSFSLRKHLGLEVKKQSFSWGNIDFVASQESGFDYFDPAQVLRYATKIERPVPASRRLSRRRLREPLRKLPAPGALRKLPSAHAVRSLDDLRGYLCGMEWLQLDLLVIRDGKEVVVRQRLQEVTRWLPVRLWRPELTRYEGFDLVRVADLPPEGRPQKVKPEDLLVVRVARDAPLGRNGLRPLDVISRGCLALFLSGGTLDDELVSFSLFPGQEAVMAEAVALSRAMEKRDGKLPVRAADGTTKWIRPRKRERPIDLWIPFLFSYQSDGIRTHLGIGPLDLLFHYSDSARYEPETGGYVEQHRWSAGTSIQSLATKRESGTVDSGGINPLLDITRGEYFLKWFDAPSTTRDRNMGWR